MVDILIYGITAMFAVVFGMCLLFLVWLSEVFNISYIEASVYVNIYFQGFISLLSFIGVLYYSIKNLVKCDNFKYIIFIVYSILFIVAHFVLLSHYTFDVSHAFYTCQSDMSYLSEVLLPKISILPYVNVYWQNYYIINVLVFIVGFLTTLTANYYIVKFLKRQYKNNTSKKDY